MNIEKTGTIENIFFFQSLFHCAKESKKYDEQSIS